MCIIELRWIILIPVDILKSVVLLWINVKLHTHFQFLHTCINIHVLLIYIFYYANIEKYKYECVSGFKIDSKHNYTHKQLYIFNVFLYISRYSSFII